MPKLPSHVIGSMTPAVADLKEWLALSEIAVCPLFRKVNRGSVVEVARLSTDAVRQILLKRAAKATYSPVGSLGDTRRLEE